MGVILGVHFLEVHLVAFFDDVNSKPIFGDALEKACRCDKEVLRYQVYPMIQKS